MNRFVSQKTQCIKIVDIQKRKEVSKCAYILVYTYARECEFVSAYLKLTGRIIKISSGPIKFGICRQWVLRTKQKEAEKMKSIISLSQVYRVECVCWLQCWQIRWNCVVTTKAFCSDQSEVSNLGDDQCWTILFFLHYY